uniref:Ig-like domain-containing protein n=1 Tax=Strigops habroptila TaxID=2489341 RepID=A0A672TG09_STRHB
TVLDTSCRKELCFQHRFSCYRDVSRITQTSSLVLKEDDKATLTCSQNYDDTFMYWYLQQPGKGLQLICYSPGPNQEFKGDIHIEYKAQRPNRSDFSLDIFSVKMNYSAVYFCASSLNTALQSHFLSLHKLLSFSVLSLRREPLSAQEEGM